jgi:hypothetical protein
MSSLMQEEFDAFLGYLDESQENLRSAALLMDGIEGFADGGEQAFTAAMSAIDALRKIETRYRSDHPPDDHVA